MSRQLAFAAIAPLPSADPHRLRLRAPGLVAEVASVLPGVVRLRVARGRRLSERASWAVLGDRLQPERCEIRRRHRELTVRSQSFAFRLDLRSGAWEFRRADRSLCFSAGRGETDFDRQEPLLNLRLVPDESLFGLGETSGTFNKRGLIREFWNTDVLGHSSCIHAGLRSLYVSIPFAISLRRGLAAGLFWDNPAKQTWDLGQTRLDRWQMRAESGELDLYLFTGPTPARVVEQFTELTGRMPLPPRWALGYHQCRFSYETRARVEQVAREFRRRRIPCDAIYFDLHHMDGHRVFTFGETYPKPSELIHKLARQGFKVVTIVDPGVKDDPAFDVLQRGERANAFVKGGDGKDYVGRVWAGESRFPDFLNQRVRQWWAAEQGALVRLGVAGFWNDMNEPANFALPSKTLPPECRHESDCGPLTHAEAHNLYGLQMARASYEGALAHRPGERPFVITRAGYAGVQRYALVWTGDNASCWEHLGDSLQMLLSLSVSGVPFVGSDVGGFMDNCTPELLARWTQMAAFTPFFRNHSNLGTIGQEPWAFGPEVEAVCRRSIELRYQLLPYLYGTFVQAHRHGTPIMRPLLWDYADDPVAVATGDQFLLGADLLVAPILRQGAVARSVYLPRGDWFDFRSGRRHKGEQHIIAHAPLDTLPVFVRAGAIIPMIPTQQFIGERRDGTIKVDCWPGAAGACHWYEDDGQSLAYESGAFLEREIISQLTVAGGTVRFAEAEGNHATGVKHWRVTLRGAEKELRAEVNGKRCPHRFDRATESVSCQIPNQPGPIELVLV